MNIEKAIVMALEYENKVRDVYVEAVEQVSDPIAKKALQVLADEEQRHVDYLEMKLEQWKKTGAVTADGLNTAIPSKKDIEAGLKKLKESMKPKGRQVLAEHETVLRRALEVEVKTSDFYRQMVEQLPPAERPLFQRFMEIEEGHVAIVQAELDAVTGLGFWFDIQEFNLSAG
jgi:rubrerythrin